ncbi:MAG TPA: ATP-binding protein [Candidatus Aquilonibacter sp.]
MLLQFSSILNVARMDDPSRLQEWRFHASDAQAAHVARREIGAYIRRLAGDTEASNSSELIVGELIANTVEHAPGLVHLMMEWTDAQPVFTVRDSGPGLAAFPTELPADIMNERSRGLFLAHSLASSVTVTVSPTGGAELRVVLPLVQRIGEGPMRTADDQHRGDS